MRPNEFVQWLKDRKLFGYVDDYHPYFKKVLKDLMGLKRQTILIAGDLGLPRKRSSAIMMGCYMLAAKRLNLDFKLAFQSPKYRKDHADPVIIRAVEDLPENNAMALCLSGKLGSLKRAGKSYRSYIKSKNIRFVSTPSLMELPTQNFNYLVKAIDVDYEAMRRKGKNLKNLLDSAKEVCITTPKGSDFYFDIRGMKAISNDGEYNGGGGNIPAGEVYIPPKGKGVSGTIVIDGSSRHNEGTMMIKTPIRLKVEKGEVIDITGGKEAKTLSDTLDAICKQSKYPWGVKRIGELGIGINPNARVIGPTIINEKTLGTCHVALGSNAWFGGSIYAISHLDQVMLNPNIFVDDKKVLIK